jgi:hypothetical protein
MEIVIDMSEFEKAMAELDPKNFKKAINSTVNKVGSKVKTQIAKEITGRYNISSKMVKKYISFKKSNLSDMHYNIRVKSYTKNARNFMSKSMSIKKGDVGGIQVKIRKSAGKKVIKGSFVGSNDHGGQIVFQRVKGTQMVSKKNKREKIKAVNTIAISKMLRKSSQIKIEKMATEHFSKTLKHQMDFYQGKN